MLEGKIFRKQAKLNVILIKKMSSKIFMFQHSKKFLAKLSIRVCDVKYFQIPDENNEAEGEVY